MLLDAGTVIGDFDHDPAAAMLGGQTEHAFLGLAGGEAIARRFDAVIDGCRGKWVIPDQPLISRTAMMSTPYWSSPMAKEMICVGAEAARAAAELPIST